MRLKMLWLILPAVLLFRLPTVSANEPAVTGSYTVSLPASITLTSNTSTDGFNMGSIYEAKVKGTIDADKYVVVTPYERSNLVLADRSGITANSKIVQKEVSWSSDDLGDGSIEAIKDGAIYADITKPGIYSGDAEFRFYMSDEYVKTEYHSHMYIKTLIKEATCTEDGEYAFMCRCGEINHVEPIPATGHDYTEKDIPSSCSEKGYTLHTCLNCGDFYKDNYKELLEHEYGEPVYEWVNNTCEASKSCKNCTDKISEKATVTETVIKEPNCTLKGETQLTAEFTNNDFKTQTKTIVVETNSNHAYKDPTYEWSEDGKYCTAKRVCENNPMHIETEKATTTSHVKTPATCTKKGVTTYEATYNNPAFTSQTKDIENINAIGHKFLAPTYVWSTDGKTCVATRVCKNDSSHEETEAATITNDVITNPTCTEKGVTKYTATFTNNAFSTQIKELTDIPALGHTEVSVGNGITPTCTEKGKESDTKCSVCGTILSIGNELPATGHTFTETYIWSDDKTSCKAERSCDCGYTETETATVTKTKTAEPTCQTTGEYLYTAVFANTGFSIQEIKEEIPKLAHNYEDIVVPPTETSEGYTIHTCSECGDVYMDNYTDPIAPVTHSPGIYDADWNLISTEELTPELVAAKRTVSTNLPKAMGLDPSSVAHIVLPEGTTSIGQRAFANCSGLISVTIPDTCITVGNGSFMNCESLTELKMGDSVESIGVSAFYGCTSLSNVTLSKSLMYIYTEAFSTTAITSITIPASVVEIDAIAFAMNNLETAYFENKEGWYVVDAYGEVAAENIDLSDPKASAWLLCSEYSVGYDWFRE